MGKIYRSKSISLAEDVWAALDKARRAQGTTEKPASYNTILRQCMSGQGVFEPERVEPEGVGVIVSAAVPVQRQVAEFHKRVTRPQRQKGDRTR